MKKVLYVISLLVLTVTPSITFAHYYGEENPDHCNTGIRVEVSKDNGANWYSYDSSDATPLGTGYTLPVRPGDSIKIRVMAWNEGSNNCVVNITGENTGLEYLNTSGIIDNLDEDDNSVEFLPPPSGISPTANLVMGSTSATSGYESFSIDATVKSDAPVNASISLSYSISAVNPWISEGNSGRSLVRGIIDALVPTAHADDDGTATSGIRMEVAAPTSPTTTVSELPKTGGDNDILALIPVAFILPAYFLLKRKVFYKLK